MQTPPRRQQRRLLQLDGVRALAIVSVFLHHAFHVRLLWMGVDLFFVLSGFLITSILYGSKGGRFRDYIGHFYGRRVRRIVPPYVIVLVISGIVFGVGWLKYWYLYIGAMNFLAPLHLPNLSTLPLWSLAVEEQFYLFWPFAVFYLNRKRLVQLTVFLMVLTPVLRYACTPLFAKHWAIYMLLPFRMDTLAAGAFFALTWPQVRERVGASRRLRWAICGCGLLAMAAALVTLELLSRRGVTTYGNTALGNSLIYEMALILVSAVFLLALIGIGRQVLSIWPLVWLGRISYSIYLIHLTVLALLPGHMALPAVGVTLAYAIAMWVLVEAPILGQGRGEKQQEAKIVVQSEEPILK
jgi:peptidoglycan/LPS O-acetylase OafA/YrhL